MGFRTPPHLPGSTAIIDSKASIVATCLVCVASNIEAENPVSLFVREDCRMPLSDMRAKTWWLDLTPRVALYAPALESQWRLQVRKLDSRWDAKLLQVIWMNIRFSETKRQATILARLQTKNLFKNSNSYRRTGVPSNWHLGCVGFRKSIFSNWLHVLENVCSILNEVKLALWSRLVANRILNANPCNSKGTQLVTQRLQGARRSLAEYAKLPPDHQVPRHHGRNHSTN